MLSDVLLSCATKGDHLAAPAKATTIRIDDDLRSQAVSILDSMGLSFNSYVQLATRQLVIQRRIPFDLVAPSEVPNEKTHRALAEAEARALGLIPDTSPTFASTDQLMTYLDETQ